MKSEILISDSSFATDSKLKDVRWVITSGGVLMRDSANNLLGSARLSGFNFIRFINQLRPKMMIPHQLFGTAAMDIG